MSRFKVLAYVAAAVLFGSAFAGAQVTQVRRIDGRENNAENADWGAAGTRLLRMMPAAYPGDGSGDVIVEFPERPNPRDISNRLAAQDGSIVNARRLTDMVWQWGQFIDHDINLTETAGESSTADILISDPTDPLAPFIPFTRSVYDPQTGTAEEPRQQINAITAYIDGSCIYGSDEETAASLRTSEGGRLKSDADGLLLPKNENGMFVSGDVRVNEQVALTAMHTLFMREHNRLAGVIAEQNPTFSDEDIYQMARKIIGAEIQIITYEEFLPALLGAVAPSRMGGQVYDPQMNASITNEFSTAFYRFGHSMLSPHLLLVDETGETVETLPLRDAFFNPAYLTENPQRVELVLRGLFTQQAQEIDNKIVDDVRNFLFGEPGDGGLDLASLNIQRGRDHGLPDFNSLRQAAGLRAFTRFDQINSDPAVLAALEEFYVDVNNIDAWVGGLAEDHTESPGSVGTTVAAVLRTQFERLRTGDRFYWRRDPDLQTQQVRSVIQLRDVSLSRIIRLNTDIEHVPSNVFRLPRPRGDTRPPR